MCVFLFCGDTPHSVPAGVPALLGKCETEYICWILNTDCLSACQNHLTSFTRHNLHDTASSWCPVFPPSPGLMPACLHPAAGEGARGGRGCAWKGGWLGHACEHPWGTHIYKLLSVLGCCRRSKQSNRQLQQHVKKQMSKKKRRICPCLKFRGELTSSATGSAWLAWACQARSCRHHCQVSHSCIFFCSLSQEHCFS